MEEAEPQPRCHAVQGGIGSLPGKPTAVYTFRNPKGILLLTSSQAWGCHKALHVRASRVAYFADPSHYPYLDF